MHGASGQSTKIPGLFHRIWFGPAPVPEKYQAWWSAWQRQYPEFEFRTWRDADIASLGITEEKIREADGYARKADIARYEILLKFGGVYVDCDMQPCQRYDFENEDAELIVCNETSDKRYCSIGFIAAKKGHPVFRDAIENILATQLNQSPANKETGPWLFGRVLEGHECKQLPSIAFYPYHYDESFSAIYKRSLQATYGIHFWAGSYLDASQKISGVSDALRALNLNELGKLASELSSPDKEAIRQFVDCTRAARQSVVDCALLPLWGSLPQVQENQPFELQKILNFLLEDQPDTVIWQVGAADGILVDPLRASMILHNPKAVLFEPNPCLFEKLEKNYSRNDQAQLVPCALAARSGQITLNAIEPEVARSLDLPDWVDGISSVYSDRNAIGGKTIGPELTAEIQKCIRRIEVQALTIEQARSISVHDDPDVLIIDVEGMDAEVIHAALDHGIKPNVIQFETQCLPTHEADSLEQRLEREYTIIRFGNDSIALRHDFLVRYANELYVEHGVPTIFNDRISAVLLSESNQQF